MNAPIDRLFRVLLVVMAAAGVCKPERALADTATLTPTDAATATFSSGTTVLDVPIARSGDSGYDVVLTYHTVDGSAHAGTDYTAASGSLLIPEGASGAGIPVTILAHAADANTLAFQVVVDSTVGVGASPMFAAQSNPATAANPVAVAVADIDGDGKLDLIVANQGASSVSVFTNTTAPGSAPSFSTKVDYPLTAGSSPWGIAAADINGDGRPDIVVADSGTNKVSVLLNTGAPGTTNFAAAQDFAVGSSPAGVAVGDINGDGKIDIVAANSGASSVSMLFNTTALGAATASFAAQATVSVGGNVQGVALADLDGDGLLDLIAGNYTNSNIGVRRNTTAPGATTPSFAAQQTFATANLPNWVAVGDVNGDGRADIVSANVAANNASVLINTTTSPGSIGFASHVDFNTGSQPWDIVLADLNGDGKSDLVVSNSASGVNTLSVLRNTTAAGATTPSFEAQQTFPSGAFPSGIVVADFNGDGKPDLVAANVLSNDLSVLQNTTPATAATPAFAAQAGFGSGGNSFEAIATADLDGDGRPDFVTPNFTPVNYYAYVFHNTTATGASLPSFDYALPFAAGTEPTGIAVADVNGDGRPDLLLSDNGSAFSVLLNTTTGPGATTFSGATDFSTGGQPSAMAAADLNGDGRPDAIATDVVSNRLDAALNTTAPGATAPTFGTVSTPSTGSLPRWTAIADVNGDGKPDLITANTTSPNGTVSVLLNTTGSADSSPRFAAHVDCNTAGQDNPYSVVAVDLNGDGKPDFATANLGTASVSVFMNANGPGANPFVCPTVQTIAVGAGSTSIAAADANGDGRPDLILSNPFANTLTVLLNTTPLGAGSASFNAMPTLPASGSLEGVTTADVNGDGKPDLAVADYNGNIVVLLNTLHDVAGTGKSATVTISHDRIFADGFE